MGFYPFALLPPGGPAGGVLAGSYPNPGFAAAPSFTGLLSSAGSVDVTTAGSGLRVAESAGAAKQGTFVLSGAATTTVADTAVTANSRIFLQTQALGTVTSASTLAVSSRVAGTSFTVTPSQATDTSTVAYEIFEPG
jgi:hypothetical protein